MLLITLFVPYVAVAQGQFIAGDKPNYVGVNEGQTYIWRTEFDKGPLEDYYEDSGYSEALAELAADSEFDWYRWSSKTEAWKIYVVEIKDEKEADLGGKKVDRVKFIYNWYKSKYREDPDAWRKIDKYETWTIYEPDEELYEGIAWDLEHGPGNYHLFLPRGLHLEDIVDEIDEDIEDMGWDDSYDAGIDEVKVRYFFREKVVGIETQYNYKDTSQVEEFESISKYNDDGILYYYEYTYDGDIIAKYELEFMGIMGAEFITENWWWIVLAAGAAVVVVIVLVIVLVVKKKKK